MILNVEEDHLDYYRDIEHIKSAFLKFADKTEKLIVINGDDENASAIMEKIKDKKDKKIVSFGIKNGKYTARNIKPERLMTEYDLYCDNVFLAKITLKVSGMHNVLNSLAASALCLENGIDISSVKSALFDFEGTERRMQYKGEYNGADIYDDYAHHPTEIMITIASAHQKSPKRLVLLFQPHTYTRTIAFKQEFIKALSNADKVYIADIYAAREKNPGNVSSEGLTEGIKNSVYAGSLDNAYEMIKDELRSGDIFITVGAGDVYKVGERLLAKR